MRRALLGIVGGYRHRTRVRHLAIDADQPINSQEIAPLHVQDQGEPGHQNAQRLPCPQLAQGSPSQVGGAESASKCPELKAPGNAICPGMVTFIDVAKINVTA